LDRFLWEFGKNNAAVGRVHVLRYDEEVI
jgi:hypothetical protein